MHPGTILPGLIGVVLLLGSLVWAMVDRYPGESLWPTSNMLFRPLLNLTLAVVLAGIAIVFLARSLPRTRLYGRLVLSESVPAAAVGNEMAVSSALLAGMAGLAVTALRPSGKAQIGGSVLDVVSRGEYIAEGTAVRIISVEGARVVVEPA